LKLTGEPTLPEIPGGKFFLDSPTVESFGQFLVGGDSGVFTVSNWKQVEFTPPSEDEITLEVRYSNTPNQPTSGKLIAKATLIQR
jgi:hypothetical protein